MSIAFFIGLLYGFFLIPSMYIFFKISRHYGITFSEFDKYDWVAFTIFFVFPYFAIPVFALNAASELFED